MPAFVEFLDEPPIIIRLSCHPGQSVLLLEFNVAEVEGQRPIEHKLREAFFMSAVNSNKITFHFTLESPLHSSKFSEDIFCISALSTSPNCRMCMYM